MLRGQAEILILDSDFLELGMAGSRVAGFAR